MGKLSRITLAGIAAWLGLILLSFLVLLRQPGEVQGSDPSAQLAEALAELETLRREVSALGAPPPRPAPAPPEALPNEEAPSAQRRPDPALLRRNQNGLLELWFFLRAELKKSGAHQLSKSFFERWADAFVTAEELSSAGLPRGLPSLAARVQGRIHSLQFPLDCKRRKQLVCSLAKGCGFGCQIHHVAYCLITAYSLGRTMILNTAGWRYTERGWESLFRPLSNCSQRGAAEGWSGDGGTADVVQLPIVDDVAPRPRSLPLAIPADVAAELGASHGLPPAWWLGQLLAFLCRYSDGLAKEIEERTTKLSFSGPIVGVHVRRTDKVLAEAAFHELDEYMAWAEEWWGLLEMRHLHNGSQAPPRKVFIASDDPKVFAEAREKYKEWEVLGDEGVARSAQPRSRYSDASIRGLLADVHFLARSDFLVCTFSSQVCRVAYELMQTLHSEDYSGRFRSLDDQFYYGGQGGHVVHARLPHSGHGLELKRGDKVRRTTLGASAPWTTSSTTAARAATSSTPDSLTPATAWSSRGGTR